MNNFQLQIQALESAGTHPSKWNNQVKNILQNYVLNGGPSGERGLRILRNLEDGKDLKQVGDLYGVPPQRICTILLNIRGHALTSLHRQQRIAEAYRTSRVRVLNRA